MQRLAFDRIGSVRKRAQFNRFARGQKAEHSYARYLRGVARKVGSIVKAFAPDGIVDDMTPLQWTLARYAEMLGPWARAIAMGMLDDVSRRDASAWAAHGKEMSRLLRKEIETAPTGAAMRVLLDEQVALITSLPLDAGKRVHKLVTESLIDSSRASEIAKEILRSGDVTASRATMIARTETARASSVLTQVRAAHVGCTQAYWRTAGDSDVRDSHRAMNGKVFDLSRAPTLSDGTTTFPGQIYNCRCHMEPIVPDVLV